jgi:hypothetical protein
MVRKYERKRDSKKEIDYSKQVARNKKTKKRERTVEGKIKDKST